MGVHVLPESVADELAGIIVWSDRRQEWVAAINPNMPRDQQCQTYRDLCARVSEDCTDLAYAS